MSSQHTASAVPTSTTTKFDDAFIERRMRVHRQWQEDQVAADAAEIVSEVITAFSHVASRRDRECRSRRLRGAAA